jgi:hypothetical protein
MSDSTVTIGGTTKDLKDADAAWIASQLNGRKHAGSVCVRVRIKTADVDICLASGACPSAGGGGGYRQPNGKEQQILDLWSQKRLNQTEFSTGELVSFVNAVRHDI